MNETNVSDENTLPNAGSLVDPQAFVSDLIRRHGGGPSFSARAILEQFPILKDHHSCLIDLAYEEFCRLKESGAPVSPTEFAGRYREIEQSLHRVIELDQILHDHPEFVESIPDEQWPKTGAEFCGFRLIELIGRGTLSRVFVARQERLGNRAVVAKVCARGEQEARLLGQLKHPSIAAIHSIDTDPATRLSVICMPYQTRATLHHVSEIAQRIAEGGELTEAVVRAAVDRVNGDDPNLPLEAESPGHQRQTETRGFAGLFVDWGESLASALQVAHELEILHCDVKPGNVLVLPDLSVQLLDFNLASAGTGQQQIFGGTLPYMASEQLMQVISNDVETTADGEPLPRASATSDVFGLCATLWHFLTGQPPFGAAIDQPNRVAAAKLILSRQEKKLSIESIGSAAALVPPAVVEVLIRGMSFDAPARQQSAEELAQQLRLAFPRPPAPRMNSRRRVLLSGLVVVAVALSVGTMIPGRGVSQQQTLDEAAALTAAGRHAEAARILTEYLEIDPGEAAVSYELAASLVRQHQVRRALEIVAPFRSQSSDPKLKYLDLYCQSLLAVPFFEDFEGKSQEPNRKAADEEWRRLIDEWQQLSQFPNVAHAAEINSAAMWLEGGDFRNCKAKVDGLGASVFAKAERTRICKCVALSDQVSAKLRGNSAGIRPGGSQAQPDADWLTTGLVSTQDFVDELRRTPFTEMTRMETQQLIILSALELPSPGTPETAKSSDAAENLLSMVNGAVGRQTAPGDLRMLYHLSPVLSNESLRSEIGRTLRRPCTGIDNRLRLLLIPPDDVLAL